MRYVAILASLVLAAPSLAWGQAPGPVVVGPGQAAPALPSWLDQVFPERSFEMGNVARGSRVHHVFPVVNRTNQEIHIADTLKKCGCTEVVLGARDIPPGTQTYVEVVLDTTRFQGYKPSGVTLVLDRPSPLNVELNLSAFIRDDVMISPGSADFGTVIRGKPSTVTMALTNTGANPGWRVVGMETISPNVSAELSGAGPQFQLQVKLAGDLPVGAFKDEITLKTNDPRAPVIPVSVTANVQGRVTLSPSTLVLGRLKPGQVVTRQVFLRASQACKVTEARPQKGEISAAQPDESARPMHPLTVTIKAPSQPGPYAAVLEIATDLADEPAAKLSAFATITP